MARGKVQLKRIENPVHRQVTFCKRRAGLLKKARELSTLCDADIGVIIFSTHGKLYELSTNGTMQELIERYMKSSHGAQTEQPENVNHPPDVQHEINLLKQEINTLQKAIRFMFGDGTGSMTLDELHVLERNLEVWICQIRSTKNQIMFQELQLLKNKEDTLMAANELLQQQLQEQSSTCGIPLFKGGIHGIPYPLTLHNEAFQV
ncbi:hypothetical protein AMTRI_Chr11g158030 [Amborella trichopoda]